MYKTLCYYHEIISSNPHNSAKQAFSTFYNRLKKRGWDWFNKFPQTPHRKWQSQDLRQVELQNPGSEAPPWTLPGDVVQ